MPAWSLAGSELIYRFRRVRSLERMDEPGLPPAELAQALEGLERISRWWGQREPLLTAIEGMLGPPTSKRLRLIEVGAGSGYTARWVAGKLAERGYRAEVLATDLHPTIFPGVGRLDALHGKLPDADLYFSNLFLHHLPDAALPTLFARQARASRLGFIHYDLQRHWAHYYVALFRTRFARLPSINQTDALLSIQQGYTRAELKGFSAGLPGAEVRWCLPFRWMLTWRRA